MLLFKSNHKIIVDYPNCNRKNLDFKRCSSLILEYIFQFIILKIAL